MLCIAPEVVVELPPLRHKGNPGIGIQDGQQVLTQLFKGRIGCDGCLRFRIPRLHPLDRLCAGDVFEPCVGVWVLCDRSSVDVLRRLCRGEMAVGKEGWGQETCNEKDRLPMSSHGIIPLSKPIPPVCLDVISLVASRCGYNKSEIEPRVAPSCTVHVATPRGRAE